MSHDTIIEIHKQASSTVAFKVQKRCVLRCTIGAPSIALFKFKNAIEGAPYVAYTFAIPIAFQSATRDPFYVVLQVQRNEQHLSFSLRTFFCVP